MGKSMLQNLYWNLTLVLVSLVFTICSVKCTAENIYVTMQLDSEVVRIGEDMVLTCIIHGLQKIDNELIRQWSKDTDLICHNGNVNDPSKYSERPPQGNKFNLTVKNVTESDLHSIYQCSYGFYVQTKKLEIRNMKFEYPPTSNTTQIEYKTYDYGNSTILIHFNKVFPLPNCIAEYEGKSQELQIFKNTTNGIYHDVSLKLVSKQSLNCNENIRVHCRLVTKYHFNVSDENCLCHGKSNSKTILIIVVCCTSVIILFIMVAIFKCILHKREFQEKTEARRNHEEILLHNSSSSSGNSTGHQEFDRFLKNNTDLTTIDEDKCVN